MQFLCYFPCLWADCVLLLVLHLCVDALLLRHIFLPLYIFCVAKCVVPLRLLFECECCVIPHATRERQGYTCIPTQPSRNNVLFKNGYMILGIVFVCERACVEYNVSIDIQYQCCFKHILTNNARFLTHYKVCDVSPQSWHILKI